MLYPLSYPSTHSFLLSLHSSLLSPLLFPRSAQPSPLFFPLPVIRPLFLQHSTLSATTRLVDGLLEAGYAQLTLPVLALQEVLTRASFWSCDSDGSSPPPAAEHSWPGTVCPATNLLVRLKSMQVCCMLGLAKGITFHQQALETLTPNEEQISEALSFRVERDGLNKRADVKRKHCKTPLRLLRMALSWIGLAEELVLLGQEAPAERFLKAAHLILPSTSLTEVTAAHYNAKDICTLIVSIHSLFAHLCPSSHPA
ncbi:unnamed protein product [Protopolystoma xenopodis]|uniref:Uncharacterized protein n=1 Tax=Protopolystoma xenopodis TaxID=117903 RepID=A0A3S5CTX2_9PLAT|nr:unnamed protein product [Protopolystoma xenopodis]